LEASSEIDLKYFLGEFFGQPNIPFKNNSQQCKILHPISADSNILIFEKSDLKNHWFWLFQNPQRTHGYKCGSLEISIILREPWL
jgi:hypothetical protein